MLNKIAGALRQSVTDTSNAKGLCEACIATMEWGGVRNGNVKWLKDNKMSLHRIVNTTRDILAQHDDSRTGEIKRFNAGMTKVYSLLLDDFIIYDSRVAAALAWLVQEWRHETGRKDALATLLAFPCMPPKEGKNAARQKCRNPDDSLFPWMKNDAARHATWNLRASWILVEALELGSKKTFQRLDSSAPLRALEAALFMMGYDLNDLPPLEVRKFASGNGTTSGWRQEQLTVLCDFCKDRPATTSVERWDTFQIFNPRANDSVPACADCASRNQQIWFT